MNDLIPLADLSTMATTMAKAGLFQKTPEQLLSLMLIAQAEGIHPAVAAQEFDVIQGRPAITSRAALSRFQAAGGSIKWLVRTDAAAKLWLHHPQGGELTVEWTIERARKAGLAEKDNWKKYPAAMLSARCIAEGVRAVFPACLARMYLSEEAGDMEPMRDVTPPLAEIAPPAPEEPPAPAIEDPRARLAELVADPLLIEDGRAAIQAALANEATPEPELFDLIQRAERAIANAKAKKEKAK